MANYRKGFRRLVGLLTVLALAVLVVISGCSRPPKRNRTEIDETPYLGTWECVGVKDSNGIMTLEEHAASSGTTYSARMVVRDNGFAYLLEESNGEIDSSVIPWLKQDYKVVGDSELGKKVPTGPLYSEGYFELEDAKLLKPFSEGRKLVFSKESDSMEPLLRPAQLPACTIDIPIELMDDYEWQINNLGGLDSMADRKYLGLRGESVDGRNYTSAKLHVNWSVKGSDEHPEGEEVVLDGNAVYRSTNGDAPDSDLKTSVQFMVEKEAYPGAGICDVYLYEVSFYVDEGERQYYENYVNSFLVSFRLGNEVMADVETVSDTDADTSADGGGHDEGPISWKDAPQHVGEYVEVFGTVAETNYSPGSDGQPTFIDIGEAYPSPNRVTAVIWGEDRGSFPEAPEDMYAGRYIKVEGELYQRDGVYNIRVTSPSQIVVR